MKPQSIISLIFIFVSINCNDNKELTKGRGGNKELPLHIIILVDLSDRDLNKMNTNIPLGYDLEVLNKIPKILERKYYNDKKLDLEDKINLLVTHDDNGIEINKYYNENSNKFKIDFTDIMIQTGSKSIKINVDIFKKQFNELTEHFMHLEKIALRNTTPYGGDITLFLNEKMELISKFTKYNTVLIILTDGYEVFDSNHSTALAKKEFNFLKVGLFGINIKNETKNSKEFSKVKSYWQKKFVDSLGLESQNILISKLNDIDLIELNLEKLLEQN